MGGDFLLTPKLLSYGERPAAGRLSGASRTAPAWPQLMLRSRPSVCGVQMAVLPGPTGASAPWAGLWPRERRSQVWLFLQRVLCTVPGLGGGGWPDWRGWPRPLRTLRDQKCHPGLCLCQGLLLAGETGSLLCLGGLDWEALLTAAWAGLRRLTRPLPHRLEQPYFSANAQFFQALSQCPALQRLCLVSRSGTLQPEAVLAFMARCLHVVVCHMFTGESLATCKSLQQTLLRR